MKIKSYITAAVCMLWGTCGLRAQATLTMENFHIIPGETRAVSINMSNRVEVRALQVLIDLPDHVRLVSRPTVNPHRKGMVINESGEKMEAVKSLNYRIRENGDCMIVVNANDAVPFFGTEGAVITLTLKADEKAVDCREEICLKNMELVFADGMTYVRPDDYVCTVDVCSEVTSLRPLMTELDGPVDVYTLNGIKVKTAVPVVDLEKTLPQGVYVIEGVKVYVK